MWSAVVSNVMLNFPSIASSVALVIMVNVVWLMQCFESSDNSSVRKSSMLCLVALYDKVGKDLLPQLATLNPSKVLSFVS